MYIYQNIRQMLEEKEKDLEKGITEEAHSENTESIPDTEKKEATTPEKEAVRDDAPLDSKLTEIKEDIHTEIEAPKPATSEIATKSEEKIDPVNSSKKEAIAGAEKSEVPPQKKEENVLDEIEAVEPATSKIAANSAEKAAPVATSKEKTTAVTEKSEVPPQKKEEDVLDEIDESNAEDAEDADNHHRHRIPILDYHAMSMENLVGELQRLVRNEKVQAIKTHVDGIKYEFDQKFQEFLEGKKEEFIANGGNEIDFRYNSVAKRQFKEVYADYREKRNQHYKNLEKSHKDNLSKRLALIESLKSLVSIEEDMNTTYKNFKDIQEQWRHAGPVPSAHYNNVWKTYHHHVEIFYDFLHLNRELRDLDFKHNLEEKKKLAERAEALSQHEDLSVAFRELQTLHKIWKEDIGPVDKEHREEIWERFSNATKILHQRRQDHYKELEKQFERNLEHKKELINKINAIAEDVSDNHKGLQQQIKQVQELRETFFNAGRIPQKDNGPTWTAFKQATRRFNQSKNAYYKNLKKEQHDNLDKKRALIKLAHELENSEEWDMATSEMKRIQSEWKKIGHVPRKYSDKIWKEFKNACNHYFDRLHALKNKGHKEEEENLEQKVACLEKLKAFELSGNREKDLATLKTFIETWRSYGRVPFNKKHINQKFDKILDAIFKKLKISRQESELLKYGNKIQRLANNDDAYAISKERNFIRKKIDESKNEVRQLETNLQFFSNASEDNPMVQEVIKKVENHKDALTTWKAKLKKLNIMENNLNKEVEEDEEVAEANSENTDEGKE